MKTEQAITPDLALLWTYDAKSYFDAMRARNEHLGREPYRPEPEWEDTIHSDGRAVGAAIAAMLFPQPNGASPD